MMRIAVGMLQCFVNQELQRSGNVSVHRGTDLGRISSPPTEAPVKRAGKVLCRRRKTVSQQQRWTMLIDRN